jgi:hypothetical protein
MSKSEIIVIGGGRAHKGLFEISKFEQFVKPFGAIASGLLGIEARSLS